ncbi:MAG: SRPBCC family protein [Bacteroidia bacterium]|nr:SRPBCC family protein [Bacteroidia bacterium]
MKIQVKRQIKAPAEALWKYLGDYANIHRFHPLLKGSYFNEGTESCEIGSTRQCDLKNGDYLKERITEWNEGSSYSVEIYETSMPVKSATATLAVKPIDKNNSEVSMDISMEAKHAIMAPIMYLSFRYSVAPGILKGLDKLYHQENKIALA